MFPYREPLTSPVPQKTLDARKGWAVLDELPLRGSGVAEAGLAVPPARMPRWQRGRPLKRWRYLGAYGPELMVCAGDARIGPLRQRFWAVATPDGQIVERTALAGSGGVSVALPVVTIDFGNGTVVTRTLHGNIATYVCATDGSELELSREETFVLSRVDGRMTVGDLSDMTGLDTTLHVAKNMVDSYGDRFYIHPGMKDLVEDGNYGQKTGKGFYEHGS